MSISSVSRFGAIQIHHIDPKTKALTVTLTDNDRGLNPYRDLKMPDTFELHLPSNGSEDGITPPSFTLKYPLPSKPSSSVQFKLQSDADIQRLTPLFADMLPTKLTNNHPRVKALLHQAGFDKNQTPNELNMQSARVLAGHGRALFSNVKDAKTLNQTNRDFVEWHWLLEDLKKAFTQF